MSYTAVTNFQKQSLSVHYINGTSDAPSPIVTSKVQYHLSVIKRSRCKKTGKVAQIDELNCNF